MGKSEQCLVERDIQNQAIFDPRQRPHFWLAKVDLDFFHFVERVPVKVDNDVRPASRLPITRE